MGLTAATLDRGRGFVAGDQVTREIEAALGQHGRPVGQFPGRAHDLDVAFHVLVRPAAGVGNVGKLRKDKSELGEEAEHLAGNRLDIVLAADDDKSRDLVANNTRLRIVTAFCTQFSRSAILK